jgi:hypothetical protein
MDAWIKLRLGLATHPKIVRIASALNADRLRVIGALYAVWSLADEHTEDGVLTGYTLAALDESVGFAGFSNELKAVSWLHESAQGIVLPRFDEHNGRSAKRRAQEAQRKRDGRKTSASNADTLRTRERERVRSKSPVSPLNLPAGITEPDWQAFRDHRAASRKRLTPRAEELALAKLHALTANGYDAKKLLEHAIEAGWMTFYEREECRASGGAARATAGPCACGEVGTAKVGGTWRCVAHVRGFEVAA